MIKEEVCVSCSALPLLFHPTSRVLGFVNEREGGNLARESERRQGKLSLCTNLFQVPQGFFTPPHPTTEIPSRDLGRPGKGSNRQRPVR